MTDARARSARTATLARLLGATSLAAIAAALMAQALLRMPSSELGRFIAYLAVSGVATVSIALLARHLLDRAGRITLQRRLVIALGIATSVSVVNVIVAAWLMFISTTHDLPLLIALLLFSSLLSVILTLSTVSEASREVDRVVAVVGQLAVGNYFQRLPVLGRDEFGRLSAEVNELATRLEQARANQEDMDRERRELTVAVSHDLRTPLASVRAIVEALADGVVQSPDERARYYVLMRRELDRLTAMLDDLFDLSRIDAGAFPLSRTPLPLEEVVGDVVEAMRPQAERQGVGLCFSVADDLPLLEIDGTQLHRVAGNLVRNALEHSSKGGTVEVALELAGSNVNLSVRDSGEGIQPPDLARIWQRFYRGEPSRHRRTDDGSGTGLGLAIVKGIVEAHGGTVSAASEPGRGATFVITLPVSSEAHRVRRGVPVGR